MASRSSFLVAFLVALTSAYPLAQSQNNGTCSAVLDQQLPPFVPSDFTFSGNVRQYYIAAEQVAWNYAPSGWDNILGVQIEHSPVAEAAGYNAPGSLGLTWQKALYRQYTDATFTQLADRPPWLGNTGPILRAEVGDMIEIMFVNKLPGLYASMHSMGLAYNKNNEGSLYTNVSGIHQENIPAYSDKVPPGGCTVYKWLVNDASAPTRGTSHVWGYHSFISMEQDQNAGLTGSTIVYSRGQMNATMSKYREFVLIYMSFDESKSSMSAVNRALMTGQAANQHDNSTYWPTISNSPGNQSTWQPQITNWQAGYKQLTSTQAPTFMALNGLVLQNNAPFEMCVNDPTMWYVSAFGRASHVFHMHGNGFKYNGDNLASISINDGEMKTLNSTMIAQGQWDLICHVSNHFEKGMVDEYVVYPADSCPLPPLVK